MKDQRLRNTWIAIVQGWNKKVHDAVEQPMICSAHFPPEHLIKRFDMVRLKSGIIPTIRNVVELMPVADGQINEVKIESDVDESQSVVDESVENVKFHSV